jgi:hypothetical protein
MNDPTNPLTDLDLDDAAEAAALTAAVEKARTGRRGVPHAEVRAWMLEIAAGNTTLPPPAARDL